MGFCETLFTLNGFLNGGAIFWGIAAFVSWVAFRQHREWLDRKTRNARLQGTIDGKELMKEEYELNGYSYSMLRSQDALRRCRDYAKSLSRMNEDPDTSEKAREMAKKQLKETLEEMAELENSIVETETKLRSKASLDSTGDSDKRKLP